MTSIGGDYYNKRVKLRDTDTDTTSSINISSTSDFSNFPPDFYDQLTTIHLTARALREHNRRNRFLSSPKSKSLHNLYPGDIKRFARQGGPDLTDIRGISPPDGFLDSVTMSSKDTNLGRQNKRPNQDSDEPTPKKKRTSAYDGNFEEVMRDNGVYISTHRFTNGRRAPEPINLEDMIEALSTRRASISSDDSLQSMYEEFRSYNTGQSESFWKQNALPLIKGKQEAFFSDSDVIMTNLDPLTKYDTVVRLKPDFYDGAAFDDVDLEVRRKLNQLIVPTRVDCKIVCPNFFMEVKKPDGGVAVLKRQAMHGGAVGARAMHSLQNYGLKPSIYDDKAYTISVTFQDGRLLFFAHHVTSGVKTDFPEYFMTLIDDFEMSIRRKFPKGVIAFRNARDWAKITRDQLMEEANDRASSGSIMERPILPTSPENSELNSEE